MVKSSTVGSTITALLKLKRRNWSSNNYREQPGRWQSHCTAPHSSPEVITSVGNLTKRSDLECTPVLQEVRIVATTRENENSLRQMFSEIYNQKETDKGKKIRQVFSCFHQKVKHEEDCSLCPLPSKFWKENMTILMSFHHHQDLSPSQDCYYTICGWQTPT